MGKSAGPTPDFQGAATQQGQSGQQSINQQTAANRPNINSPFASQSWNQSPNGEWNLTTGLAGGLGGATTALQNQAGEALSQGMDPSLFGPVGNGDAARNQAIEGAYGQATSRLDPRFAQQEDNLNATLANQGLSPTSAAARAARGDFNRNKNDAYSSAMNSAIGQGTEAGQAVFGQNLQAHQQALSDALTRRNAPLGEISQLNQLANSAPGFNQAGAWDPTQYLTAASAGGDYNLRNAEQQNQMWGGLAQGLLGAAGSFAKMSDVRLKKNIEYQMREVLPGVPWATWSYIWESDDTRHSGVIAQDLEKVAPEYVETDQNGWKRVNYRFLKDEVPS